jgi:hypothetical protein
MMTKHCNFVLSSFKHFIKLIDEVTALTKLAVRYKVTNTDKALSIGTDAQQASDFTNQMSSHS